jgi:hypothetical protein
MRHSAITAILLGGLIAGTIDVGSASVISGFNPKTILHAIASGVLGANSFYGGLPTAALGLVLQWVMLLIIAAVYVIAATRIELLQRLWIVGGLAYGVVIFFVMTDIVVPLSAAPFGHRAMSLIKVGENMLAMLLFGLIVAFFARAKRKAA